MPNLVISPKISRGGERPSAQLHPISFMSIGVLQETQAGRPRLQGYITENKDYCVYLSPTENVAREQSGPCALAGSWISRIRSMMHTIKAERLKEAS